MKRFPLLRTLLTAGIATLAVAAQAQDWPAKKVITMVVPFAAGGSTDVTARALAAGMAKELGQQVIVENKAGAASNIGVAAVARAQPDGYTILLGTSTMATNATLYKNPGYNLRKDLIPVSLVSTIPLGVMVRTDYPAKSLSDFVQHVKSNKGNVRYGSSGNGASQHLAASLFSSMVGADMLHVPYKGGAPANTDLIGGQIDVVFAPLIEVLGFVDGGKLRALGVTTKTRSPRLPNVPAINEVLPGYEVVLWNGVFAPAGTPDAIVNRIAEAVQKVVKEPGFRRALEDQASVPVGNSPADFAKFLSAEIDHWAKLVKVSGASLND
ncbi:tripartite tricarboxylate transporter substrate binding protein [Calidifontimicrobium sp. SYSU G02091]|uniref:Bug family tripartite tricarboxylate transporter substrate binding protein n=1 Tax=Calidifontimicrobium sp. SYSU G02091 TaxID=2926421 RepID=UPI001F534ADE|nr:tripartite tricarboxylate transporter substrate binding protein [Calidifontimicrobium sp. SYSU G02091]MCI1193375.1 tripartite tricarboxylate transporter substrate binding protein [Calidifontimicrobium sp. SYSU G02091]